MAAITLLPSDEVLAMLSQNMAPWLIEYFKLEFEKMAEA